MFDIGATKSVRVTDHTTFEILGPAKFADWLLWRLWWLIRDGVYSPSHLLEVQRFGVKSVQESRGEGGSVTDSQQAVREALFGRTHPYARTRDEAIRAAIAHMRIEDLEAFQRREYVPIGATLIITGRFDPEHMRSTVTRLFSEWKGPQPHPSPAVPAMQPSHGPTWIASEETGSLRVGLSLYFAASSSRRNARGARAVLAELVRERVGRVRIQMGASHGINAAYASLPAGDLLLVNGAVDPARAGEVIRRVMADLERLRAGDAELPSDFVRARRKALAAALADPAIPSATAQSIENSIILRAPVAQTSLAVAVAATTLRDVIILASQDLQPARMVGVLTGPQAYTSAALATAGVTGARFIRDTRKTATTAKPATAATPGTPVRPAAP